LYRQYELYYVIGDERDIVRHCTGKEGSLMEGTIVVSPGLPEVAPKANVRLSPDRAVASGSNGNGEHANSNAKRVKEFEHLLATMEKKTIRINPERLSTADREKLISRMNLLIFSWTPVNLK
jgi:hypothetical protein